MTDEQQRVEVYDAWATISNTGTINQTNLTLSGYQTRTNMINSILSASIENGLNGVVVDFRGINNNHNFERFLIELAPRLREIGMTTGVYIRHDADEENIREIVDYIVM